MANQENRTCDVLNQKLIIESGSEVVGYAGKTAYIMESRTEDNILYNQSLHEGSGLSRVSADKTLQVESGAKCDNNEAGFNLTVHNGNTLITNMNGDISIQGRKITIGAHDELVLQAPKVRIGFLGGETTDINLVSSKIQLKARSSCKLNNKILYSSTFAAFARAFVSVNKWYNSLPSG